MYYYCAYGFSCLLSALNPRGGPETLLVAREDDTGLGETAHLIAVKMAQHDGNVEDVDALEAIVVDALQLDKLFLGGDKD